MSKLRTILLVTLLALAALPSAVAAADSTHTVQSGETLTSIAARYGTTVDELVQANGLSSANLIYVGQTLKVPGGAPDAPATNAPPPASTDGGTYVVQAGDTLYGIAVRYGTTVDALMQANGLTERGLIYAGQRLTVPGSSAAPSPSQDQPKPSATKETVTVPDEGTTYTVQAGDYLAGIANRFGVSVEAIVAANNLGDPNLIHSGLVLKIPGANQPISTATPTPVKPTATPAAPTNTPTPLPNRPDDKPDEGAVPVTPAAGSVVEYVVQAGDRLYTIAANYGTTVDAIIAKNGLSNPNMIYPGQKLQIVVGDKAPVPGVDDKSEPSKATGSENKVPNTTGQTGKWIDVNISAQTLTAFEGDTAVYTAIVSTGTSVHPTVIGTFKVYAKYLYDDMTGGSGADYYYLPNVPHTMYFYGGYAIHGTYWHNNFGHPMSHGCVNLSQTDAEWIYNWTPIGTVVVTHW